jgi:excisionase family DNA binding protein
MGRRTALELSPPHASSETTALGDVGTVVAADASQRLARRAGSYASQGMADASLAEAPRVDRTNQSGNVAPSKVLNLAEAAALVRCSRAHLSNVVNGKVHGIPRLPAVRIGRRVLFRRESLESWLQQIESITPLPHSR